MQTSLLWYRLDRALRLAGCILAGLAYHAARFVRWVFGLAVLALCIVTGGAGLVVLVTAGVPAVAGLVCAVLAYSVFQYCSAPRGPA